MKSKQAQKLIETLAASGAEELSAIDEQIATLEAELEAEAAERRKTIDALKRLRAVLDLQVNGKKPKAAKKPRAAKAAPDGEGGGRIRDRIFDFLSKQDIPLKPVAIADAIGCSKPSAYAALKHEWFKETPDGYEIARA